MLVVSLFYIWLSYIEYNDVHKKDTQNYLFFCNKSYEVHPILFWIKHAYIPLLKQITMYIASMYTILPVQILVVLLLHYKMEKMHFIIPYFLQIYLQETIGMIPICLKEISYITYLTYDYILY